MSGTLRIVGVGPGDPDLMTLKAARVIAAAPIIAYFAKSGRPGHARGIATAHIAPGAREIRLDYPYTTEIPVTEPRYAAGLATFYADAAATFSREIEAGSDVALLCEGDPYFYGSSLALLDRLRAFRCEVIPGVTGMSGCWTRADAPMTHGDDILTVLPGTLDEDRLVAALTRTDAAVIMKLGRNLAKARAALARAGLLDRALYVERGTMAGERVLPLAEMTGSAPYFSMVLVPGRQRPR